jgi:hypothetical protein
MTRYFAIGLIFGLGLCTALILSAFASIPGTKLLDKWAEFWDRHSP